MEKGGVLGVGGRGDEGCSLVGGQKRWKEYLGVLISFYHLLRSNDSSHFFINSNSFKHQEEHP